MDKDNAKLTLLINCLNTHCTPNLKRGLINVIESISKTLFGTIDAEDVILINEYRTSDRSAILKAKKYVIK